MLEIFIEISNYRIDNFSSSGSMRKTKGREMVKFQFHNQMKTQYSVTKPTDTLRPKKKEKESAVEGKRKTGKVFSVHPS